MAGLLAVLTKALPSAGNAAAQQDWSAVANALGREAIGKVEVRSQITPPVSVDPFAPGEPGPPNPILALVKPEVRVYDPAGNLLFAVAPAGPPTENYFPGMVVAGTIAALGGLALLRWLMRRLS